VSTSATTPSWSGDLLRWRNFSSSIDGRLFRSCDIGKQGIPAIASMLTGLGWAYEAPKSVPCYLANCCFLSMITVPHADFLLLLFFLKHYTTIFHPFNKLSVFTIQMTFDKLNIKKTAQPQKHFHCSSELEALGFRYVPRKVIFCCSWPQCISKILTKTAKREKQRGMIISSFRFANWCATSIPASVHWYLLPYTSYSRVYWYEKVNFGVIGVCSLNTMIM